MIDAVSTGQRITSSARVGFSVGEVFVRRFAESELELIWDRRGEGVGMRTVATELGRAPASVRTMVECHGGVPIVERHRLNF